MALAPHFEGRQSPGALAKSSAPGVDRGGSSQLRFPAGSCCGFDGMDFMRTWPNRYASPFSSISIGSASRPSFKSLTGNEIAHEYALKSTQEFMQKRGVSIRPEHEHYFFHVREHPYVAASLLAASPHSVGTRSSSGRRRRRPLARLRHCENVLSCLPRSSASHSLLQAIIATVRVTSESEVLTSNKPKKLRAVMTGGAKAVRGANHRPATLWAGALPTKGRN